MRLNVEGLEEKTKAGYRVFFFNLASSFKWFCQHHWGTGFQYPAQGRTCTDKTMSRTAVKLLWYCNDHCHARLIMIPPKWIYPTGAVVCPETTTDRTCWTMRIFPGVCLEVRICNNWRTDIMSYVKHARLYNNAIQGENRYFSGQFQDAQRLFYLSCIFSGVFWYDFHFTHFKLFCGSMI